MSNYENLEDEIVDELTEVKASMGDPSEVADAVEKGDNKKRVDMKGSAKAAKLKGVEDKEDSSSMSLPVKESKFGMLNAMIAEMQKMSSEEVAEIYAAFAEDMETVSEDADSEETETETKTEAYKFNVEEEIASVFSGEELSEEFKDKAATIFEAVVSARVNEEVEKFISSAAEDLAEQKEALVVSIEEKVNTYLDYVVGEWMEQNALAVEQGIKSDIVEDFMTSMKGLFVEHYIEVPEDKVDVVEQLISKVSELEENLNIVMQENVEMSEMISESAKSSAFAEVSEGMVATDVEKFTKFASSIEASDADDYVEKLKVIKEHYFSGDSSASKNASVVLREDAEPYVELEEETTTLSPGMQSYAAAISRTAKK